MNNHFATKLLSLAFLGATVASAQSTPPQKDIPTIAKAANGAVVSIVMSDKDGNPIAQGSGFVVGKDGLILTNYHVIAEGASAVVKLPSGAFYGVDGVVASDKKRDIALIKAHGTAFRTLPLGDSDRVQVGEAVVAIGNPLSLDSTVSNGIVSGIRTEEELGGKFLQISAPISPGSSGGPLFNMDGEVIGITTMYLKQGENLNFAIPVNDAKVLLLKQSTRLQALPNEAESENVTEVSKKDNDSSQQSCDERAGKFAGYQRQEYGQVPLEYGYMAHYDANTNRCYVEIVMDFGSTKDQTASRPYGPFFVPRSYLIEDAFTDGDLGPLYGECYIDQDRASSCKIYPQGGTTDNDFQPVIGCRSEEEFDDVAQKYFGITIPAKPTIPANETEQSEKDATDAGSPPLQQPSPLADTPVATPSAQPEEASDLAREYFQGLYRAGGLSNGAADHVCFSDDSTSDSFFTFGALAYDKHYTDSSNLTLPNAAYINLIPDNSLKGFPKKWQKFYEKGGQTLVQYVYGKGVKVNQFVYRWNGNSWIAWIHQGGWTSTTYAIRDLLIEPTTMRYEESAKIETKYGPDAGVQNLGTRYGICEKLPNNK